MEVISEDLNKWVPRALEMFGDERGGQTNVEFGLKPMKNGEAQEQYATRWTRSSTTSTCATCAPACPELGRPRREQRLATLLARPRRRSRDVLARICCVCRTASSSVAAASRRSPWSASTARPTTSVDDYAAHLAQHLPDGLPRQPRLPGFYLETLREVATAGRRAGGASAACRSCAGSAASARARRRCAGWPTTRPAMAERWRRRGRLRGHGSSAGPRVGGCICAGPAPR